MKVRRELMTRMYNSEHHQNILQHADAINTVQYCNNNGPIAQKQTKLLLPWWVSSLNSQTIVFYQ